MLCMKENYHDIASMARNDPEFRSKLGALMVRLSDSRQPDKQQIIMDVLRTCRYNMGLLLPWFFPNFNGPGSHLSLFSRPFNFPIFAFLFGGYLVLRGSRQIGKALEENEPVLTPRGWVPIKDLRIGDQVYGSDGTPARVTGVFPQGVRPVYRMTFSDQSQVLCDEEHLWLCKTNGAAAFSVKSLKQIRARKGGDAPTSDQGIRIPLCAPVQMPAVDHFIPPYLLGLLIGDGSLTPGNCKFSTSDAELLDAFASTPHWVIKPVARQCYAVTTDHGYKRAPGSKSPLNLELERLDLRKRAEHKAIPEEYLFDSQQNRLELLRGLMDTDGSIYGKCQMEYYTASIRLAEQVQYLVESLGGKAKINIKKTHYTKAGKRVNCLDCYRVKIQIQGSCPFKLSRKARKFYDVKYDRVRILERIECVGSRPAVCITVDSSDNTFITRNCIVTHNSTSISSRQLCMTKLVRPWVSHYIAPHSEHIKTYATKLSEMQRCFRYGGKTSGFRNNLYFKEFPGPSQIEINRVLTSSGHMRGKTCDEICYDEYQLFDSRLEAELEQLQRNSKTPVTIYSGTSTTIDSPLEARFQASSGCIWHIRRPDGKGFINCGDPQLVLKMFRREGLYCPYSDRPLLNTADGMLVPTNVGKASENIIGLHVPQFIIPEFTTGIEWNKIWKYFKQWGEARTLQEVAGIPVEQGNLEISQKDLQEMCCLPFRDREEIQRALKAGRLSYRYIVSGCDWGGTDFEMARMAKTSYTVHVMLGVHGDGTMDILHMHRYSGMNYDEIAALIVKKHIELGGCMIASDAGAGSAYNTFLHKDIRINPARHLVFQYNAPHSPMLSRPAAPHFATHFLLNKTESITFMLDAIKHGRIRCYSWEAAQDCLTDLLHSRRIHSESPTGKQFFKHIRNNPSLPDDFMHGINFAFTAARTLLKEPLFDDPGVREYMYQMIGDASVSTWKHGGNQSFGSLVVSG